MSFQRLGAIALIFFGTTLAWSILGSSLLARTGQFDSRLEHDVQLLWGGVHRQVAPNAWVFRPGTETETVETKEPDGKIVRKQVTKAVRRTWPAHLESTRAKVDLGLEHRRKGLLWYPTYTVGFNGTFQFRNPDEEERELHVRLPLPAQDALFDDFVFTIDGRTVVPAHDVSKEIVAVTTAAPGATVRLDARYTSRGIGSWTYAFVPTGVAQVKDFDLTMQTNFKGIDYPAGAVSPSTKRETPNGWQLGWTFSNLISGQAIGMALPEKLNPGPFAARVTFFAPVSLLFYFAVMVIMGATYGPRLHPMHYWFIAAAFFAFHLLLAYLVDHVAIHWAFAAAALVSVGLVMSYLRAVAGMRQALLRAGVSQVVFLVLFSYAFFFEGVTGLAITIGAIVTLYAMMQMTAHLSWDEVFQAGTSRTSLQPREHTDANRG